MTHPIERIEEIRLTAPDDARIAVLLERAFVTGFGGRSYFQQRHHLRLIWREEDRVLGHMALTLRDIRLGDDLVTIVGLAEVATDSAHRGRGIATALMDAAIREARASVAAFIVLFGNQPLYSAVGFVPQPNRLRFVDMDDARTGGIQTSGPEGLMVLPLTSQSWDPSAMVDLLGTLF
jgi:predicted N-acetyltransferase YhbS